MYRVPFLPATFPKNNRDPPLRLAISLLTPALPPSLSFCLSIPLGSPPPGRHILSTAPPVFVCVFVSLLVLFACMRAISLRVCLSAPETPAPPRWVWSPGPARRTRQPLSNHTARYPPRTRSSTPTNSAWTPSGARWRPSDRGVATRTWTAAGETPDSQKVNTALSTTDGCRLHTRSPHGFMRKNYTPLI